MAIQKQLEFILREQQTMIKIIKKETQTNINLEKIEQLYLENKTKVSNLLRFDGQDPESLLQH